MFNELVESVSTRKKTNTTWGVIASLSMQCACLLALILIPLIYTQALPSTIFGSVLIAPAPPPQPTPPQTIRKVVAAHRTRLFEHNVLQAPTKIPGRVEIFREPDLPPESPGNNISADVSTTTNLLRNPDAGPAAPPPSPANTAKRIRLGGNVQSAKLLAQPQPAYPALAIQARVQGTVILHAIINRQGEVSELQVISGHPLLVQAALDAVRRWRYQPTELNGDPVEVDTTITVSFLLGG
jgi:periplasmic protein TonB